MPLNLSSPDLIHTAQRIEEAAWYDMYVAAPERYARENGMRVERLAHATCFAHTGIPLRFLNRALRLGTLAPIDRAAVDETLAWMRDHAGHVGVACVEPNTPLQVREWLDIKGMHPRSAGVARFVRAADTPAEGLADGIEVRQAGNADRDTYASVVQPAIVADWFVQLVGRERWYVYVAYDGATPVASAVMYIEDDAAWLGASATLEAHRRKGAQGKLLARRINDAIALGVTSLHVETGMPDYGITFGPSYRNIERAGFERLFVRQEYGMP